ncbi:MAG TPA: contractile injection system protein, VgrG/Pvc8 family [Roseiarcus sp.]|nr:contractile injection system protein, VgrG/Pvc8 family [Roseiarcus sp.]
MKEGPLVPEIDVLINGARVPAAVLGYIEDVVVDDSVELPSMFAFAVSSSDALEQDSPWVDNDLFSVGNVVEIRMGWGNDMSSMIIGEITALEAEFAASRLPLLNVRGYDRRHRLQRGRKTRTFLQKKDSDIAAQIGGEAGLTVKSTDSGTSLDYVLQASQTDWEFLCERARLIGYEVLLSDKTLQFRPIGNAQPPIVTLSWGEDLLEFHPRLSAAGQATEVKIQSWSVKDKKAVLGDSKAGDEVSSMGGRLSGAAISESAFGAAIEVVSGHPVSAQAEADQIAKALFNELVLEFVTGECVCVGNTNIRAGTVIKIDGVGRRFSGPYYVTSAVHRCSAGGYVTEFAVRRNAS